MADTKISALSAVASAALANELAVNEAGTSKKASLTQVKTLLGAGNGLQRVTVLANDHTTVSTHTTGTEVTELQQTLEAGTYAFKYILVNSSSATGTGLGFGLNFTGTHTRLAAMRYNVATITTASNGISEAESGAALLTGGVMNAWFTKAESTTAPTTVSAGVETQNVDMLDIIEGLIVVTVSGDLELWHSSETNAASTLESGSCLIVTRVA